MKILRRIAIGFGLLLFMLCCGAVLLTGRSTFGWQAMSVPTGSMRPEIGTGSLVVVHRVSDYTLKVGDVITFTNPATMKGTITHRIVRIDKLEAGAPRYVTKGDANKTADALPAIDGLIKGKMVFHVPYIGSGFMWAKTWVGIALLVYVPAVILLFGEMRRMIAYWRLSTPKDYRLFGYGPKVTGRSHAVRYVATGLAVAFVGLSAVVAIPAYALLSTNVVTVSPNTLSVAPIVKPPASTCTNNTDVHVSDTSDQTATAGSASTSGNTTGGSATSGNASNTNSSSTNISVTNSC